MSRTTRLVPFRHSRNGTRAKPAVTDADPVQVDMPRDRVGTFGPVIVSQGETTPGGVDRIILPLTSSA